METQETGKTLKDYFKHYTFGEMGVVKRIVQVEVTWNPSVTAAFALIPLPILVNFIP